MFIIFFFFSSRSRHTRFSRDWSSDVCSSDLEDCLGRRRSRRSEMAETPETPQVPDAGDRPRIGVDEWVAEAEGRDERYRGRLGELRRRYDQIPVPGRFAAFLIVAATVPFMTSSDYIVRVGINTLLFALLALGLNVVVGYAGLLDLGYIAFYGFGAYMYGILSSNQFHIHWPAEATVPLVIVGSARLGR